MRRFLCGLPALARTRRSLAGIVGVAFLIAIGASSAGAASPVVPAVDLGTLGGTSSFALAMNASAQVVGQSDVTGDAEQHPFSWRQAGGMVDLGTLGGSYGQATGVNNNGQVVGVSNVAGNASEHAFLGRRRAGWSISALWAGRTVLLAGWIEPSTVINDSGQVVGGSATPGDAEVHAFLWTQADGMVDLGTLGGTRVTPSRSATQARWSALALSPETPSHMRSHGQRQVAS